MVRSSSDSSERAVDTKYVSIKKEVLISFVHIIIVFINEPVKAKKKKRWKSDSSPRLKPGAFSLKI